LGVIKSHTTPYHPQGDGMVEHSNWMLHSCVEQEANWERYLFLVMLAYYLRSLMQTGFLNGFTATDVFDPASHQAQLQH